MENTIVTLTNLCALPALFLTDFGTVLNTLVLFSMLSSMMYHYIEKCRHCMEPSTHVPKQIEDALLAVDRVCATSLVLYVLWSANLDSVIGYGPHMALLSLIWFSSNYDYLVGLEVPPEYRRYIRWWYVFWHSIWHIGAFELLRRIIVVDRLG
jgi:hypothetical protein